LHDAILAIIYVKFGIAVVVGPGVFLFDLLLVLTHFAQALAKIACG
jgi:hypothetical protein